MLEKVCKPVGLGFLPFLLVPVGVHIAETLFQLSKSKMKFIRVWWFEKIISQFENQNCARIIA